MQNIRIDATDRRIIALLQTEPGINASAIDREKIGLNTMVFAHVKLTSHGRSNLSAFSEAVRRYPEVLDCYVLLGNVDFLLRVVTEDIKAYEQFFFEKLSQLEGIQEVHSSIVLSETKHTSVLPI